MPGETFIYIKKDGTIMNDREYKLHELQYYCQEEMSLERFKSSDSIPPYRDKNVIAKIRVIEKTK